VAAWEVQQASLWNDALSRAFVASFLLLLTVAAHGAGIALWHAVGASFRTGVPLPSWLVFAGALRCAACQPAAHLRLPALQAPRNLELLLAGLAWLA
jgi:uncharacterized membrane protein YidH (DUF202 family)